MRAASEIALFAELLERAPEHIHTYRLTLLGLWNARAAGHDAEARHRHTAALFALRRAACSLVDIATRWTSTVASRLIDDPANGLGVMAVETIFQLA